MAEKKEQTEKISKQVEKKVKTKEKEPVIEPNFSSVVSSGSTLLDLAISGGVVRGGGIPGGILMEIFGPPAIGKTALLCEIGGSLERQGGQHNFFDPEARLSTTFANIFDLQLKEDEIQHPDTPLDIFPKIREWEPDKTNVINGCFIDSTAALASDLEMEDKKDEYSRRAKLFSQEFRKTCRVLNKKNLLIAFSNQVREKMDAGAFAEKTDTPGGQAIKFYSSLRLQAKKMASGHKIKNSITYQGKKIEKTVGVGIDINVYKSSIWEPFHSAPVYILFDYGIDDIRANLEFVKKHTNNSIYYVYETKLSNSLEDAILKVEEKDLEEELKTQVIDIWEEIENKFKKDRKSKKR